MNKLIAIYYFTNWVCYPSGFPVNAKHTGPEINVAGIRLDIRSPCTTFMFIVQNILNLKKQQLNIKYTWIPITLLGISSSTVHVQVNVIIMAVIITGAFITRHGIRFHD